VAAHGAGPSRREESRLMKLISQQWRSRFDREDRVGADHRALAAELTSAIEGEVRFDRGSRALYSTDASNYRQVPIGVVVPKTTDDVVATLHVCRERGAPVLSRGGGTSLAGECCNVAVVVDFSKYLNAIIEIDPTKKRARVAPGCTLDELNHAATAQHRLTFGPDPSTHAQCTLGGMIGNNACGVHSVLAGKERARTSDNVAEMNVVTYDGTRMRVGPTSDLELDEIIRTGGRRGEIYGRMRDLRDRYSGLIRERFPTIPRRVSGYNLDDLLPERGFNVARVLAGSEGTLAAILDATVELVEWPRTTVLLALGYSDVFRAADDVPAILEHAPMGLEGMDDRIVGAVREKRLYPGFENLLPEGGGWLLVEFGGDAPGEAEHLAELCVRDLDGSASSPAMVLHRDPAAQAVLWRVRESGLGATSYSSRYGEAWPGWEDSAVAPPDLGRYLRDLRRLFDRYGYSAALYGHFGQGCIHSRINFDFRTAEGIDRYRRFVYEAAHLVTRYGGSISGEHGDGQARGELLPIMFGEELMHAFRELKTIWDPQWKMNPGKVIDPYRNDEHLRLHPDSYRPRAVDTQFALSEDGGAFFHAAQRCVGVGKCRRLDGGTMCPSYMVTREEKHTTRGRAHMLFEMMQGEVLAKGWRDDNVFESLELCLSCKGCKIECPVGVDMANYKAEFLSHYYKRRLRPRAAYALGLIFVWARVGSLVPNLANLALHASVVSGVLKRAAGVAQQRPAPRLASTTLRHWFAGRRKPASSGPRVVLWPDTFSDYFHPEVGRAAVEVLEAAGYSVALPPRSLCCGRPLYDYGMLDTAQLLLRRTLAALQPEIESGTPIVGLEPSCVAVFRDELTELLPHDEDARRLGKQFVTLGELLQAADVDLPRLSAKALVHPHCHHEAVMGLAAEKALLDRLGLEWETTGAGCCGLAGSFGFEAGTKHDVSVAAGNRKLAPLIRNSEESTLLVADGFSCRTQIEHLTGRRALHTAEVVHMAVNGARDPSIRAPGKLGRGGPSPVEVLLLAGAAAGALFGLGTARRRWG
jgi:FAD/FMN-containing dehydrogenase/Fe-S oxidoreductase